MSHFTVLVIGDNIETQLQPFHEFECTGTSDQYVQDIDETEEKREELKTETRTVIKLASGELVSAYDERWYRPTRPGEESSGGRYGKVRDLPAGVVEVEAPFESVEAWADYHGHKLVKAGETPDTDDEHKFGYVMLDEAGGIAKAVRRTNPNRKWDWWQLGGRWSGFLKLKPGAAGTIGRRGLMGSHANDGPGYADQARKGDIDFAGMRDAAGIKAGQTWDRARAGLAPDAEWITWEQMRETIHKCDIDAARKAYNDQPAVAAIHKALDSFYTQADDFLVSRDTYVQQARDGAISTYAMVKDSQWFAKGRMGWWGLSDDKLAQDEWNRQVTAALDALPEDTLLSIVDCHI